MKSRFGFRAGFGLLLIASWAVAQPSASHPTLEQLQKRGWLIAVEGSTSLSGNPLGSRFGRGVSDRQCRASAGVPLGLRRSRSAGQRTGRLLNVRQRAPCGHAR